MTNKTIVSHIDEVLARRKKMNKPIQKRSELAEALGVSTGMIDKYCNDKSIPPLDKAYKMSYLLEIDLQDLFTYHPDVQ
ncbi:helix-turn-helix transcriptional regulator [Hazenella sp. IB182357]|uniref:Helix-turn-helix transcriptional regulator n=1 Tax=Polycladospora coralii TaxID=2771432 RepID=A0A926NDM1_9BACL|nr:helix-turn-helix transcriptional regulator [Polycladospora coralii]MBD1373885.1 helix-turn-helix transcriptional regulator [Polycladospora coralii]